MISSIGSALGVAENLVADVDAVGAGDLRRLMGERIHGVSSLVVVILRLSGNSMARFAAPQKALAVTASACPDRQMLTGPSQRCGMAKNEACIKPS